MSFESYKLLHLAAIFVFISGAAVLLLARPEQRLWKMITGLSSAVVLVAGLGMVHKHLGGAMPPWVQGKIVIWLAATGIGHVVAKRFPKHAAKAYWLTLLLATGAAALAIFQPGA